MRALLVFVTINEADARSTRRLLRPAAIMRLYFFSAAGHSGLR
jgi:hypothetical protein